MNRWRPFALTVLSVSLLAGCVYVPPYYYDYNYDGFDPVSPRPWYYPVDPHPPVGPYSRHPYDHRHYGRRHMDRGVDNRGYEPTPQNRRDSIEGSEQVIPPSKLEKVDEPRADAKDIPTATKGSKPGRVKVPFPPYNELDVSGLQPGSLAKDPTTGKVFRLP